MDMLQPPTYCAIFRYIPQFFKMFLKKYNLSKKLLAKPVKLLYIITCCDIDSYEA